MKIKPYTFAVTSDGNYFFIESISKRRLEVGLAPDKIARGVIIKKKPSVSLEGENSKSHINLRTVSFQDLSNFFYNNSAFCFKESWVYVDEIQAIVDRKEFDFTVKKDIPKI